MYKFQPLLKQTIWGGDSIIPFKHLDLQAECVGESWEISGVAGSESVVSEGPCAGMSLNDLVRKERERLMGNDNYARFGNEFPLLVKFIDARRNLSIQVHPNDEVAQRHGHARGKSEMWYVMSPSNPSPFLYCGLKQHITPEQYAQMVADGSIVDALARYDVSEGDVFFIPAGRIHSIGAASTTISAAMPTATCDSCIPARLPRPSTTVCRTIIARTTTPLPTCPSRLSVALISAQLSTTLPSPCSSTMPTLTPLSCSWV